MAAYDILHINLFEKKCFDLRTKDLLYGWFQPVADASSTLHVPLRRGRAASPCLGPLSHQHCLRDSVGVLYEAWLVGQDCKKVRSRPT